MSGATQSYVRIERPEPIVRADSVAHVVLMAEINPPTLQTATKETVWES